MKRFEVKQYGTKHAVRGIRTGRIIDFLDDEQQAHILAAICNREMNSAEAWRRLERDIAGKN